MEWTIETYVLESAFEIEILDCAKSFWDWRCWVWGMKVVDINLVTTISMEIFQIFRDRYTCLISSLLRLS
jgi:hypothetical protein